MKARARPSSSAGPNPSPTSSGIKAQHGQAEEITDRLCAAGLAGALDASRWGAFADGVRALRAATP